MKQKEKEKSQKKIIVGMIFAIIFSFASYSYAIASTTFSASDMKQKNNKIANLQTDIAELELEYFSFLGGVSLESAEEFDLHEVKNVSYASTKTNNKVAYHY